MEKFEYIIQKLRKEKGYSKKQVWERLGISDVAYWDYERGARKPSYENLKKLADLYGVSIDYLVGRTPIREVNYPSEAEDVG